jgi:hypothetical protein
MSSFSESSFVEFADAAVRMDKRFDVGDEVFFFNEEDVLMKDTIRRIAKGTLFEDDFTISCWAYYTDSGGFRFIDFGQDLNAFLTEAGAKEAAKEAVEDRLEDFKDECKRIRKVLTKINKATVVEAY